MVILGTHDIMSFEEMNGKFLQIINFLKNANKTCKLNNRDLSRLQYIAKLGQAVYFTFGREVFRTLSNV